MESASSNTQSLSDPFLNLELTHDWPELSASTIPPPYEHPDSSSTVEIVASYAVVTAEIVHQDIVHQAFVDRTSGTIANFDDIFETLEVNLPSQFQKLSAADQRDTVERFQLSYKDPFSQYTAVFPQQVNVDQVASPVSNCFSSTAKNEHNCGASSTIFNSISRLAAKKVSSTVATVGPSDREYAQFSNPSFLLETMKQYHSSSSIYSDYFGAPGVDIAGSGSQFDSYASWDYPSSLDICDDAALFNLS